MQRSYCLSGVARATAGEVNTLPILDQNPEREAVARPSRPFGCRSNFTLGGRITPLRNVAHDGRGGLPRIREGNRRTRAQRHAPFVTMDRVLAQVSPAAGNGDANGQPALCIIENEPVFAAMVGRKFFDFALCELDTSINGLLLAGSRPFGCLWLPIFAWFELASAECLALGI
jgi:hypothetical protein